MPRIASLLTFAQIAIAFVLSTPVAYGLQLRFPIGDPADGGPYEISQIFQDVPFISNGKTYSGHLGEDWKAPIGTPVFPIAPGHVERSEDYGDGWGNIVIISHADLVQGKTIFSMYAHLNTRLIKAGTNVTTTAAPIGLSGKKGTGAHLHFEIKDYGVQPISPGHGYTQQPSEHVDVLANSGVTYYRPSVFLKNHTTACGNNIIDPGEECDGTADTTCSGSCRPDCTCDPCHLIVQPNAYAPNTPATTCAPPFPFIISNPASCSDLTGEAVVFEVTSPFSVVSGGHFTVSAGQTANLDVQFCPATTGPFNHSLVFTTNHGHEVRSLQGTATAPPVCGNGTLEGNEVCDPPGSTCGTNGTCSADCLSCQSNCQFVVAPDALTFSADSGTCEDQSFTLQNQVGCGTVTGSVTGISAPFSIVSRDPISIQDGGAGILSIRFCPLANGTFEDTIQLATNEGTITRQLTGNAGAKPDLVIFNAPWRIAGTQDEGQPLTFMTVAKNQGQGAATAPFVTRFYVDLDNDNLGPIALGNGKFADVAMSLDPSTPSLAPGTTANVISAVWTAVGGTHRIIACADASDTVPESNETNNCSTEAGSR